MQDLENFLEQEKFNSSKKIELKMSQFQKYFERLKLQHQVKITEKETQLEATMDKLKSQPSVKQFIKEALEINAKLRKQKETFRQQVSITNSYCDTSKILFQQVANRRIEC